MSIIITVNPSIPLETPSSKYQFDENDKAPQQYKSINIKDLTLKEKCVLNITKSKIKTIACIIFLSLTIIGIPLIFFAKRIQNHIQQKNSVKMAAINELDHENRKFNFKVFILEKLNIPDFESIPILSFFASATIKHEDLPYSIMKCKLGNTFKIMLKLKENATNQTFIVQLSQYELDWTDHIPHVYKQKFQWQVGNKLKEIKDMNDGECIIPGEYNLSYEQYAKMCLLGDIINGTNKNSPFSLA